MWIPTKRLLHLSCGILDAVVIRGVHLQNCDPLLPVRVCGAQLSRRRVAARGAAASKDYVRVVVREAAVGDCQPYALVGSGNQDAAHHVFLAAMGRVFYLTRSM